jgi:hypothetical protein
MHGHVVDTVALGRQRHGRAPIGKQRHALRFAPGTHRRLAALLSRWAALTRRGFDAVNFFN